MNAGQPRSRVWRSPACFRKGYEGLSLQRVASQDSYRFTVNDVTGRLAAAEIIVIESR